MSCCTCRLGCLAQRETHPEVRAPRFCLENLDAAAMRVHELSDHRETDPGALHMPALRGLALVKRFEYAVAFFGRNAGPAVRDVEYQLLTLTAGVNRDRAASRGEFDGIRQEIIEDEANFAAIGGGSEILDVDVETDTLRHQRQLLVFEHRFHQWTQFELRDLKADALRLPGTKGQQVFDEPLQFHPVLAQGPGHLPLRALELTDRPVHQEFGAFPNIRERSLQFMRHMSQESILFLRQFQQSAAQP